MVILQDVIKIAENEVGYLEKASNANLDSKTANAGSNNFTKYARDLYNAGFFNGNKNGYAWCTIFVVWCFWQASGKDRAAVERALCYGGPYGASCVQSVNYYKAAQRWTTKPAVGYQVFFKDSVGDAGHTGIVYKVDNSYIYTIEGNTSGASGVVANGGGVCKKKYAINYNKILGYGMPKYDVQQEEKEMEEKRWKTVKDVPDGYKPMVQRYIDKGALKGKADGTIDLTEDMIRVMEIMRRYFEE